MSTGIMYLLVFAISITVLCIVQLKASNLKMVEPKENAAEQDKPIRTEKAAKLRNSFFHVFQSLTIRTAMSYLTDLFINETSLKIKALNRLGLRKEISFVPHKNSRDDTSNVHFITKFGKYAITDDSDKGYYREQIIDNTTGLILYEKDYKKAALSMQLIRNPDAARSKEFTCEGCGTPIQLDGEIYICKNCGAKYSADSFDWMLSKISVTNDKIIQTKTDLQKYSTIGKLGSFLVIGMIPASFFADKLIVLKYLTNFAMIFWILVAVITVVMTLLMNIPYRKLTSFDTLASPQKVADRAEYLLGLMYGCYQTEPAKMKVFMEADCYNKWQKDTKELSYLQLHDSQVFDWTSNMQSINISKFWTDSEKQYITLWTTVNYLYLTEDRQVKEATGLHQVTLCKNLNAKYRHALKVESHYCRGCGMPIDFTAEGKCKFCGNTYDIASYDWKIHSFSEPFEFLMRFFRKIFKLIGLNEQNLKSAKKALAKHVDAYKNQAPLPPQMDAENLKYRMKAYEIYMNSQKR